MKKFKVTISHQKQQVFTREVTARSQPDAIEKAWREFDPERKISPFDRAYDTLVQT